MFFFSRTSKNSSVVRNFFPRRPRGLKSFDFVFRKKLNHFFIVTPEWVFHGSFIISVDLDKHPPSEANGLWKALRQEEQSLQSLEERLSQVDETTMLLLSEHVNVAEIFGGGALKMEAGRKECEEYLDAEDP